MITLPPVLSKELTRIATGQGIKGRILIIDHSYYFEGKQNQRVRIGFQRQEAASWIARKASTLPMHTVHTEQPAAPVDPEQIELIQKPGQLSLF